jgi:hypothetical protein
MSKAKPLPFDHVDALPPWGKIRQPELAKDFLSIAPTDFRLLSGESHKERAASWKRFFEETLALINEKIWPSFDYNSRAWVGSSAAHMRRLTKADHEVLARIQSHPGGHEFYRPPASPLRALDCPIQAHLFTLEDTEKLSQSYRYYDRELAKSYSEESIESIREHSMYTKVGDVSMQFKYFLQRQRPYQTALLFASDEFGFQAAKTAHTPSMCSGHAVQCALSAAGMLERLWEDDNSLFSPRNSASVMALAQWGIDAGDRRVLAGVHYPSDNLCSWLIFLRLADRVYTNPEVKRALWCVITERSYVYREVLAASGGDSTHPYTAILAELAKAADSRP